jgi:hypothetical protein
MTWIRLIGTYTVEVPDSERRWLTEEVTNSVEATEEELAGLVLLEIEVEDESNNFDVGKLRQRDSDQAPWLEMYFSPDGTEFLGLERPPLSRFRVCYFLHHCDPSEPITSPYGTIIPGRPSPTPERLRGECIYEHPG